MKKAILMLALVFSLFTAGCIGDKPAGSGTVPEPAGQTAGQTAPNQTQDYLSDEDMGFIEENEIVEIGEML